MSTYHHGDLRTALLSQAIKVIGDKGVEGLSLRKVAKDLGVSHAAPTRHFKNKADLLAAIVAESFQELTRTILTEAENAEEPNAIKRLNLMARGTIRWALNNRGKYSVMTNPDVTRYADADLKASLAEFAGVVSAAIEDARKIGFGGEASADVLLYYAVGGAMGVATIASDELIRSVIGSPNDDLITAIANQIVPIDNI